MAGARDPHDVTNHERPDDRSGWEGRVGAADGGDGDVEGGVDGGR